MISSGLFWQCMKLCNVFNSSWGKNKNLYPYITHLLMELGTGATWPTLSDSDKWLGTENSNVLQTWKTEILFKINVIFSPTSLICCCCRIYPFTLKAVWRDQVPKPLSTHSYPMATIPAGDSMDSMEFGECDDSVGLLGLAERWESILAIRQRARRETSILDWPSAETVGVCSMILVCNYLNAEAYLGHPKSIQVCKFIIRRYEYQPGCPATCAPCPPQESPSFSHQRNTPRAAMQINAEVLVCVAEVWVTIFDFEGSGSVARTPPLHMILEQVAWPWGCFGWVTGEIRKVAYKSS